ncbi:hypothetical protein ACWPMX_07965 [Tsuneonella sp. HG094]
MARKSICSRDPALGPGSCWHWWDGCPEKIGHCIARFVAANSELKTAPEAEQKAAIDRWAAERDRARDPAPKLI